MDQRMFGDLIWSLFESCIDHLFTQPIEHHYATFKSDFIGTIANRNSSGTGLHRCKNDVKSTGIKKMGFITASVDYF